jgi:hypothetical protein
MGAAVGRRVRRGSRCRLRVNGERGVGVHQFRLGHRLDGMHCGVKSTVEIAAMDRKSAPQGRRESAAQSDDQHRVARPFAQASGPTRAFARGRVKRVKLLVCMPQIAAQIVNLDARNAPVVLESRHDTHPLNTRLRVHDSSSQSKTHTRLPPRTLVSASAGRNASRMGK